MAINSKMFSMSVIKRDGSQQKVSFDKIINRIESLCWGLDEKWIDPIDIAKETIKTIHDKMTTEEIDHISSDVCASKIMIHPDFNKLAGRIVVSNLHKTTDEDFFSIVEKMYNNTNKDGKNIKLVSDDFYEVVKNNREKIQSRLDFERDYLLTFFGIKTLQKSYLTRLRNMKDIKKNNPNAEEQALDIKYGKIVERPQHLWMRVAIGIHGADLERAFESYDLISQQYFTHGSPTLYNAGMPYPQLSSCYLLGMDDSIEGIMKTMTACAQISKWSGGIGIHISAVRGAGDEIMKTNGTSKGTIPMCKVLDSLADYVDQGGRRRGSFAIYFEPWHPDTIDLINLRMKTGDEKRRARDLFLGLWVPDLFIKRVQENGMWSFFSPYRCPDLKTTYGDEFEKLYLKYEEDEKYVSRIEARKLWDTILVAMIETGMPYMCFKDHANRKTNHQNLGVIQSSNLCVSGDTKILTNKGFLEIRKYIDKDVNVWNGEVFSKVTVRKTGENQTLDKIEFDNGETITCTPYHRFYIRTSESDMQEVRASDLKKGDTITHFNFPVVNITDKKLDDAYMSGIMCDNDFVPVEYDTESKLRWLEGYTDKNNIEDNYIQFTADNLNFMFDIKRLVNTLGADCRIVKHCEDDTVFGKQMVHKLFISPHNIHLMNKIGFSPKKFKISKSTQRDTDIKVSGVIKNIKNDDTYCFTEPLRHCGMFNGILTGQCTEIYEYSDSNEYAVCNLASICLPRFIENGVYNFQKLYEVTRVVTRNLDTVIDVNFYPTEEAKKSNAKHRPIGIGVQGLADVFNIMKMSFESDEASDLNKRIFETIYYGAMCESNQLAIEKGAYSTFKGSPVSKGILQWHMWDLKEEDLLMDWDWDSLIESIKTHGVRNSLVTAIMPTASTSQIMGNNECIEPYTSNMYVRNTIAGEYLVMNENMVRDLIDRGLWNVDIKDEILYDNGSIQQIVAIPDDVKAIYKTAFELSQKDLLKLEIERGPFIDQGASHNNFMDVPDFGKLTKILMYAWKNGLKTGQYYLRSQPVVNAHKFGLDADIRRKIQQKRGIKVFNNTDIKEKVVDDPRDVNEIEINRPKNRFSRPDNIEECEMCSG